MKAAVYYETGPPNVFRYEEMPDPQCPSDGVIVDVEAISIEGGDVLNRFDGAMPAKPHIVGYQASGTIREIGPNVTDRGTGQRVVAVMPFGSHAERVAVPANATWLLPDGMDVQQGACVPIAFGTADHCLFEFGRLQPNEVALIQAGAGGVGIAAIQLAKRSGATVLATASSDEKLERLKEFGLDHGINYKTGDFVQEAKRITNGRGVDVVVDSVGATLQGSIECLAYRGRAITVGHAGRDSKPLDYGLLGPGNRSLTGVFLGAELAMNQERVRPMISRHIEDIANGTLRLVVDRTFPLSDAAGAHAHIESRQVFGRVVLVP